MKITKVYLVRDPHHGFELYDCFDDEGMSVAQLVNYIVGMSRDDRNVWERENTALFTTAKEARKEARARLKRWKERVSKKESTGRGVSLDYVLNQLAGMRFPGQGEAYDFIKKCTADIGGSKDE